jgi:hypothetical protein
VHRLPVPLAQPEFSRSRKGFRPSASSPRCDDERGKVSVKGSTVDPASNRLLETHSLRLTLKQRLLPLLASH